MQSSRPCVCKASMQRGEVTVKDTFFFDGEGLSNLQKQTKGKHIS